MLKWLALGAALVVAARCVEFAISWRRMVAQLNQALGRTVTKRG